VFICIKCKQEVSMEDLNKDWQLGGVFHKACLRPNSNLSGRPPVKTKTGVRVMATGYKKYGLTPEQRGIMACRQDNRCAICGQKTPDLNCDHDHDTGQARGWLCLKCNGKMAAIDKVKAGSDFIIAALQYVINPPAKEFFIDYEPNPLLKDLLEFLIEKAKNSITSV
jgi:hypothetical protein